MSTPPASHPPVPFRRLFLPDPGLVSCFGHHYNYTRAVAEAAERRGIHPVVICNSNASDDIVEELSAIKLFRLGTYSEMNVEEGTPNSSLDPAKVCGYNLLHMNMYFLTELQVLGQYLNSDDMVFFHTVMDHQILAITQWLAAMPPEQRPMSNVLLRFWQIHKPYGEPLLKMCAASLSLPRFRSRFSTDTLELSTLYRNMLQTPVDILPIPHSPPSPEQRQNPRRFLPDDLDPETVVIGYLGDTRGNKGFLFLRQIILLLTHNPHRPCHFLVQISVRDTNPAILAEIELLKTMAGRNLTLVMETLSAEDYYAAMDQSDIVLISYLARDYLYSSSGIFTEASVAGKVLVVPGGTNMEHEGQRFDSGYTAFSDFNLLAIANALQAAVNDYDALSAKAKRAAVAMEAYHTADNLINQLAGPA